MMKENEPRLPADPQDVLQALSRKSMKLIWQARQKGEQLTGEESRLATAMAARFCILMLCALSRAFRSCFAA